MMEMHRRVTGCASAESRVLFADSCYRRAARLTAEASRQRWAANSVTTRSGSGQPVHKGCRKECVSAAPRRSRRDFFPKGDPLDATHVASIGSWRSNCATNTDAPSSGIAGLPSPGKCEPNGSRATDEHGASIFLSAARCAMQTAQREGTLRRAKEGRLASRRGRRPASVVALTLLPGRRRAENMKLGVFLGVR